MRTNEVAKLYANVPMGATACESEKWKSETERERERERERVRGEEPMCV